MLQIIITDEEVRRMLDRSEKNISVASLKTWFQEKTDPYMRGQFRKSFEERKSPGGRAWFRKWDETPATLIKTSGLIRSVTQKRGEVRIFGREIGMVWGHNIKLPLKGGYDKFRIHQLGSGEKGMTRTGQKIPARPMIGFRGEDKTHLIRSLAQWIRRRV